MNGDKGDEIDIVPYIEEGVMIKKPSCKIFVILENFEITQPSFVCNNSKLKNMNGDKGDKVLKFLYLFFLCSLLGHFCSEGNKLYLICFNFKENDFITIEKTNRSKTY